MQEVGLEPKTSCTLPTLTHTQIRYAIVTHLPIKEFLFFYSLNSSSSQIEHQTLTVWLTFNHCMLFFFPNCHGGLSCSPKTPSSFVIHQLTQPQPISIDLPLHGWSISIVEDPWKLKFSLFKGLKSHCNTHTILLFSSSSDFTLFSSIKSA